MGIRLFGGDVYGEIVTEESGEFGFGYDRLFQIPEMGKTLAACTMEEKNLISHRALAVKAAIPYLLSLLE
jgi:XTP/dITP diphosphohydrolase